MLSRSGRTEHVAWQVRGEDPSLVLLHGFADSAACWDPVVPALSRHAGIIAVDARGHGASDLPDGPVGPEYQATDVALALGALRPSRPVVVIGHSMGAATAVALARARPELVCAIVLEDPPPGRTSARPEGGLPPWLSRVLQLTVPQRIAQARLDNPAWPDDELEPWARSKDQLDPLLCDRPPAAIPPLAEIVPDIACPMLLLYGSTDRGGLMPVETATQCATQAGGRMTVRRFHEAGHSVRRDARSTYLAAITDFLDHLP